MEGSKFCPVANADCRREQCAWWDKYMDECAVLSMMHALWADVDEDDDDEDEEDEKKDKDSEKESDDDDDNDKDEEFKDDNIKEFKIKIKKLD